ncbi:hypothetical protein KI688_001742 [Linnemannia hyalina]|uniref:Crinkler effector protein N-terminal domain-containing protein n=1 Tax=Linnemannia hyalina TaxID=64524 RepID=A0A9P7XSK2_9FUNG|nr:hypothetical protein KI688_001742 [Linnemannia hyalina]
MRDHLQQQQPTKEEQQRPTPRYTQHEKYKEQEKAYFEHIIAEVGVENELNFRLEESKEELTGSALQQVDVDGGGQDAVGGNGDNVGEASHKSSPLSDTDIGTTIQTLKDLAGDSDVLTTDGFKRSMAEDLTLFCLIDGQSISNAFSVEINPKKTVDGLKKSIRNEKPNEFRDVDPDELTLWRVSIPITDEDDEVPIVLNFFDEKKKLGPATRLSKVFPEDLPEETIHIIVQRPLLPQSDDLNPEIAALRKQLSDMQDSSITIGIIVKPERKVICNWSAAIDTVTVSDLMKVLVEFYPQYDHDDYVELHFYITRSSPSEPIRDDEDLRRVLRVAKTQSMKQLTISLATPTKGFSAWTFKDVVSEYNLSESTDVGIEVLPPFVGIEAAPLKSDLEKEVLRHLLDEVGLRVEVMKLLGANEATRSMVVASFLLAATKLFKEDLYLASQRDLSGRRGNGALDFSVHPRETHSYTLGVTEVKKENFPQGVAQNIVQLEAALTSKKRKRGTYEIDGEEESLRSYGIVTDASQWLLLECTLHEDETVTYRMQELERTINYSGKWQEDAKFVFERLVWLWSRMRDEIPARERYSRKAISPPSDRKTTS